MRKTFVAIILLGLALIGYSAWPFVGLLGLVHAVQTRNTAEISERVDFKELRQSLTDQLIRTYLHITGRDAKLSPFAQNVLVGMAATVADPIVAKLVSPEAFADLLQSGWPSDVLPDRPTGFDGLKADKLGSIWDLYANSEYGVGKFYISVPPDRPAPQRFGLRFHLSSWTWKLYKVDLPEEIRLRLAREIMKTHPE
jgi:hypothetical protein